MNHVRKSTTDALRKRQYAKEGRCVTCGEPNDRAGQESKAHVAASRCSRCLNVAHEYVAKTRADANACRAEMAAALGLTMEQANALTKRERAK